MTGIEQKYNTLRNRLDRFGYKAPLGVESIPLVERVFADLIHTTQALKKTRLRSNDSISNTSHSQISTGKAVDDAIEPYRQDNSRLMTENNDLHKTIIDLRQSIIDQKTEFKQQAKRLQNENSDLRFLNTQYLTKIQQTEKESFAKSDKIKKLLEHNIPTVVSSPGPNAKKLAAPRRQKLMIDSTLSFSPMKAPPIPAPDDLYIVDVLKMTELRCYQLEEEIKNTKLAKHNSDERVEHVRNQKVLCENENSRLRRQLEGGRPKEAVTIEQATRTSEKIISQLNLQLEISQESQREAEDHAARLLLEIEELRQRNEKLKMEINDIGKMANVLEVERARAVEMAESAESCNKEMKLSRKISELEDQLEDVLRTRYAMELKVSELEQELEYAVPTDVETIQKERDFYQNAYRKMSANNKVSDELVTTGHVTDIIHERDAASLKLNKMENKLAETNANLKVVQQERDRVQMMNKELSDELTLARREIFSASPPSRIKPTQSTPQAILRRIECERDAAQTDLRRITCERDSLQEQLLINRNKKISNTADLEQKLEDLESRARILENERRDLLHQCEDYKNRIHSLEQDRLEHDRINAELEADMQNYKIQLDDFKITQIQVEQLRNENARLQTSLRAEVDAEKEKSALLEERVQILSGNSTEISSEISRLRALVTKMDREADALTMKLDDKTERLYEAEKQLKGQDDELGETKFKITKMDQEIELLTNQIEDLDRQDIQNRKMLDQKKELEGELKVIRETSSHEKRELHVNLELLTQENYTLRKELEILLEDNKSKSEHVEEYAQTIANLESQVIKARHEISELSSQYNCMVEKCDLYQAEVDELNAIKSLNEKEREGISNERNLISNRAMALDGEIREHVQAAGEYESQITKFSSNLKHCEDLLGEARMENEMLNTALDNAKALNMKLQENIDNTSEDVTKHINSVLNKEQICDELQDEVNRLKLQLAESENQICILEDATCSLREKQYQMEMNHLNLNTEYSALLDQTTIEREKFEQSEKELGEYRMKTFDLENEVEVKKREVTDLKFQYERTNQQLRRLQNIETDTL